MQLRDKVEKLPTIQSQGLKGWILAPQGARDRIKEFGFTIEKESISGEGVEFTVSGPTSALKLLDPYWWNWFWGLDVIYEE